MRNAEINFVNKKGLSPLHVAIENNLSKGIVKFLLQAEADPFIKDSNGKNCAQKVRELKDKYTPEDSPLFKVFWDREDDDDSFLDYTDVREIQILNTPKESVKQSPEPQK